MFSIPHPDRLMCIALFYWRSTEGILNIDKDMACITIMESATLRRTEMDLKKKKKGRDGECKWQGESRNSKLFLRS